MNEARHDTRERKKVVSTPTRRFCFPSRYSCLMMDPLLFLFLYFFIFVGLHLGSEEEKGKYWLIYFFFVRVSDG